MTRDATEDETPQRYPEVTDDLNQIFELLQVPRRRYVLYYLYEVEREVVNLDNVVDAVCDYGARSTEYGDGPPRERVCIDVYHNQIPRLSDAGIIEYDRQEGTVRFRGSASLKEWVEHARWKEIE